MADELAQILAQIKGVTEGMNDKIEAAVAAAVAKQQADREPPVGPLDLAAVNKAGKPLEFEPEVVDYDDIHGRVPRDEAELRFQKAADRVYMVSALLRKDPRECKGWQELQKAAKALSTSGTATGAEYVPTGYSDQLRAEIALLRRVPTLFDQVTIPRSPWLWPVEGNLGLPYLMSENVNDTAALIPTRTPSTRNVTFTGKTMGIRVPFSLEFDEDSIIAAEDYVRRAIAKSLVNGQETAILNGDTTATHQDSSVVTTANDCRRAWDGLRKLASVATATTFDTAETSIGTAAWEEVDVAMIRSKLSAGYGNAEDLVLIISNAAYTKLLVNATKATSLWPNYSSIDKIGPRALNLTGEVGAVMGIPIVVSAYVSDTNHTTGYETQAGTVSVAVMANRRAFVLATQRAASIVTVYDPESLQYRVVGSWRGDFKPWITQGTTTDRAVAVGIKVAI